MTRAAVGLHGGDEYRAGDEPFLRLLLERASAAAPSRVAAPTSPRPADDERRGVTVRVAIVPTAAARERPELAGRNGRRAFERVGAALGFDVRAEVVPVVDERSAADQTLADRLAAADLVHLPGGDPEVVPAVLAGSLAWRSILAARDRGAVLAGASAGAMALADWTWTPGGPHPGLGLVHGLAVLPHYERIPVTRWRAELLATGEQMPATLELGILGLDGRTGVLLEAPAGVGDVVAQVAGAGRAAWHPGGAVEPSIVGRDGDRIVLPASIRIAVG